MSTRPTLFRTKRFAAEAATTFALMLGFYVFGHWLGGAILAGLPRGENMQWVVTGPSDALFAQVKLGVAFALTPLVTLLTMVFHRLGARAHPGWRPTLIYLAIPLAAVAAGVISQVHALQTLGRVDPSMGVPYTLSVEHALPGFLTKNLLVITALVTWGAAFAAARAGRKARDSEKPS